MFSVKTLITQLYMTVVIVITRTEDWAHNTCLTPQRSYCITCIKPEKFVFGGIDFVSVNLMILAILFIPFVIFAPLSFKMFDFTIF